MTTLEKLDALICDEDFDADEARELIKKSASEIEALEKHSNEAAELIKDFIQEVKVLKHRITEHKAFIESIESQLQAERNKLA